MKMVILLLGATLALTACATALPGAGADPFGDLRKFARADVR